jgi:hypothetical protein
MSPKVTTVKVTTVKVTMVKVKAIIFKEKQESQNLQHLDDTTVNISFVKFTTTTTTATTTVIIIASSI